MHLGRDRAGQACWTFACLQAKDKLAEDQGTGCAVHRAAATCRARELVLIGGRESWRASGLE